MCKYTQLRPHVAPNALPSHGITTFENSSTRQLHPVAIWCCLFTLLLAGCDTVRLSTRDEDNQAQKGDQIALCHVGEDGSFLLLEQSQDDFSTQLLHGDGVPTGPVPKMDGFVFTTACSTTRDTDAGSCLSGMAYINGFCIDRWEASLKNQSPYSVPDGGVAQTAPGVMPQGYISGEVAEATCQAAGKRLCTSAEWLRACQGPGEMTYPYGNSYRPSACNEGREVHPIIELFGDDADWSLGQMNDARINQLPNTLNVTGKHPVCMSVEGIYDLHGNLHEWVADADGTFRGGFYVDAKINGAGCLYRTTAHGRSYHDYSTGFRCCSDAQ